MSTANSDYRVLLYYKYVPIENAEELAKKELAYCKSIGLRGRVIIADEGINGTVSGPKEVTQQYMDHLHDMTIFKDLWFKINDVSDCAHKKMFVRYRPEIVSLHLEDDIDPLKVTGKHLSPSEFREALLDDDTVVLDARNDYEYDLGHFKGAVRPNIRSFRELPQWVKDNKEKFMNKRVVTYCTGGVRCEKFSGWLLKEGFTDVAQLNGGIENYGQDQTTKGDLWDGVMYVFDERISVPVNRLKHTIVGKDWFDGTPCERYINCGNPACNRQILASVENEYKYLGSCCHDCRIAKNNRYVSKHQLTQKDLIDRLAAIGETLEGTTTSI